MLPRSALLLAALVGACANDVAPPPGDAAPACTLGVDLVAEAVLQGRLSVAPVSGNQGVCCTNVGCTGGEEAEALAAWAATPVALVGVVLGENGLPLPGATVTVQEMTFVTGADGRFVVDGLTRQGSWLRVEADGHRGDLVGVPLAAAGGVATVRLDPLVLAANGDGVRLIAAGDMMLGRRFLDPWQSTPADAIPPDDASAWIQSSDPAPGSRQVVAAIAPLLLSADLAVLNLETTVTNNPATPDVGKSYVFFTLPGSLAALASLGVSHVSLANNHICDYGAAGTADTFDSLDAAGVAYAGAGVDDSAAFTPLPLLPGLSMLGFTSAGPLAEVSCTAATGVSGAADLNRTAEVAAAIANARAAGDAPIVQLHLGEEYTFRPDAEERAHLTLAAESGAAVVLGHHPHTAQGFGHEAGAVIFRSLGNFVFDQERAETLLDVVAAVDVAGGAAEAARALPIYVERYAPRLAVGEVAARLLRRLGEQSDLTSVALAIHDGRGQLVWPPAAAVAVDRDEVIQVTIPATGWTLLDLRGLARPEESLLAARGASGGVSVRAGHDLLVWGGFEDIDVDDEILESARWEMSGPASVCALPLRGAAALCLDGDWLSGWSAAALANKPELDWYPGGGRELTLLAYVRGDCAGEIGAQLTYTTREGVVTASESFVLASGGSFAFTPTARDLAVPAATDGTVLVGLTFSHLASTEARGVVDDVALISWEDGAALTDGLVLLTPHARDFLRLEGPAGSYPVTLTLRSWRAPVEASAMCE